MSHWSPRYLRFWDAMLAPFGRYALANRNFPFGIQVMRLASTKDTKDTKKEGGSDNG